MSKRWKRIRNHLKVIVSYKGRLELWKKASLYLPYPTKKLGQKWIMRGGKFYPTNLSIQMPLLNKNDKINLAKVQKFVQDYFGPIGSRGTGWAVKNRIESSFMVTLLFMHSLLFIKLTANEQILLWIRERKLWLELPFILFYRFDFRNWDIKGRYWGGCCGVWSCLNFNLKHPPKKKIYYIYERKNTKYWQICFDPWKLSRSTKIFSWRKHCSTSLEKVWTRHHKFHKSQTW